MTFSRTSLLIAAVITATVIVQDASACGRKGGGYKQSNYGHSSYGNYGGYNSHRYSNPVIYSQPIQRTVIQQVPQVQSFPVQQQAPVQQQIPQQQAPIQQTPVQPQTAGSPVNAQLSALQALGGFAPPQQNTPAAPQVQTPDHVGNWTARLGNGMTVRLELQADGNFTWTATNQNGQASSFSGTYAAGNGSLALQRSDSQSLTGSMTLAGNSFSFKVAGNNAATINFTRS